MEIQEEHTTKEISPDMLDEMEEMQQDKAQDSQEESLLDQMEWQEAYGAPEEVKNHNQHTFLADSLHFASPEKVTFLDEWELGRPLFNLRFLLDIEDISHYYLDAICKKYKLDNKIAGYFRDKINNISESGMSKKGFVQNLNVTRKMEATRQRIKNLNLQKKNRIG